MKSNVVVVGMNRDLWRGSDRDEKDREIVIAAREMQGYRTLSRIIREIVSIQVYENNFDRMPVCFQPSI